MKELIAIQAKLNAPKSQYNKFGGYNYRSCEDILAAVKPLLEENQCTLTISDDIHMIGNRIYVKATCTLKNSKGEEVTTTAFAREEESKKGMDGSQATGASSSYARKYALNGLFAIDDTKDSDTTNDGTDAPAKTKQTQQPVHATVIPENIRKEIESAQSLEELKQIQTNYPDYKTDVTFKSLLNSRYSKITK